MAAAISFSARIVENGTKQIGHVDSVNVVNGEVSFGRFSRWEGKMTHLVHQPQRVPLRTWKAAQILVSSKVHCEAILNQFRDCG